MAKKKEENNEPIISSIPVPPSDSALVIDLPDGQKLLVGKIETGTVIEVATWRGTGRPDSRTNRLMLGMSNESDAKQASTSNEEGKAPSRKLSVPEKLIFEIVKFSKVGFAKLRVLVIQIIKMAKNRDLSKFKNLKSINLRNFQFKAKKKKIDLKSNSIQNLGIEEEFDADFQRILDEVSQRRSKKPEIGNESGKMKSSKAPIKGKATKSASKKRKK